MELFFVLADFLALFDNNDIIGVYMFFVLVIILVGAIITTLICAKIELKYHKNVKKSKTADEYFKQELIEYAVLEDEYIMTEK